MSRKFAEVAGRRPLKNFVQHFRELHALMAQVGEACAVRVPALLRRGPRVPAEVRARMGQNHPAQNHPAPAPSHRPGAGSSKNQ